MFCFVEPYLIVRRGLRRVVVDGCWLMFAGCLLRSGLPGHPMTSQTGIVVGTILVGAAQPFFQCTPALLAAAWFGPNERVLATTVAINANQIGIAMSYIVGAYMVKDTDDIHSYFLVITAFSTVLLLLGLFFFKSEPPTPPSFSGMEKGADSPGRSGGALGVVGTAGTPSRRAFAVWLEVISGMKDLLLTKGFSHPLAAFMVSIGITNVVSTFLDHLLSHLGFHQHIVGIVGALFQAMIMIGSLIIGSIVDRNKRYYRTTMFCFYLSFLWLFACSEKTLRGASFCASILALGFFVGPIQPITAELAVEVTFPADENAIVAVQMVFGNLFSAVLLPICNAARHLHLKEYGMRMDYVLLLALCGSGGFFFSTFDAPLLRLKSELAGADNDVQGSRSPLKKSGAAASSFDDEL
mmetsp:Transcript_37390/g.101237  ORF Transcript_37390/g.101237 Transcript_37390/m.101237 type:complete len:410 (+) Transcript_37390:170-1399(+)